MIQEFLESLKIKDIVFFVLFIVLFCMYFKKNKKEGFAYSSPTDPIQKGTFKADVEEALGENIQAIKNLGDFAGQLLTSNGLLDLSAVDLKLNELIINDGTTDFNILQTIKNQHRAILAAQAKADAALPKSGGTITGNLQVNTLNNIKPARWLKDRESLFHLTSSGIGLHRSHGNVIEWDPKTWKIARSKVWTDPIY